MTTGFYESTASRIEGDLATFADPGSVSLAVDRRTLLAEWKIRGEKLEGVFNISHDLGISVTIDHKKLPYRVFLADPRMADLRHLAEMVKRTGTREIFIPTRARRTDRSDAGSLPATQLLTSLYEGFSADTTQIIMVTGEAGAGKTQVLRRLVLQQAEQYLKGQTDKLLLYVNAQGRALARLNEALATELQDLRVSLTYHSVATLTRVGLLVPVIDGFDELLGVSGYDDAFGSLAAFLDQLEGEGFLIASARSVYYEEEFLSRAGGPSSTGADAWSHVPVRISPWEPQDQTAYLNEFAEQEKMGNSQKASLSARVFSVFESNPDLAEKPLFFAKTCALLREDENFFADGDLLDTLTKRFLEREREQKLLDRQQRPLLAEETLSQLMRELAEEMWQQGTRELDFESVREVAKYTLDGVSVSETARQVTIERMPTFPFLATSERQRFIRFEHEIFFFHFLAQAIARRFLQGIDLRVFLSRAPLTEFVGERVAIELEKAGLMNSVREVQEVLERTSEAGRQEWRRTVQVRENAGNIAMEVLRRFSRSENGSPREVRGISVSGMVFRGGDLHGVVFRRCAFSDIGFRRTDLVGTKFLDCAASGMLLTEPRIGAGSTRLEIAGLRAPDDVYGLHVVDDSSEMRVFAPGDIVRHLHECGLPGAGKETASLRVVSERTMSLLNKLMHAYKRANTLCEEDQRLAPLFKDPGWPGLQTLLLEHDIVRQERRQTSGPSKKFFRRLFRPEDIMQGQYKESRAGPQIVGFWKALENAKS